MHPATPRGSQAHGLQQCPHSRVLGLLPPGFQGHPPCQFVYEKHFTARTTPFKQHPWGPLGFSVSLRASRRWPGPSSFLCSPGQFLSSPGHRGIDSLKASDFLPLCTMQGAWVGVKAPVSTPRPPQAAAPQLRSTTRIFHPPHCRRRTTSPLAVRMLLSLCCNASAA